MVSISFGKSNFSEIQNSYQITVALIMMVVVLCSISSIIVAVKTSSSQEPVPIKREVAPVKSQDVAAKKELVKAVEDLETIKDRIKNVEEYGHREKYRSETNNGLTVVGTLMEQMIDVMVAVLKQPLVAEAVSKRIVNKQDADEIAEYIEMLGQEVVKEVEQTQLLKCRKAGRYVPCTEGTEDCGWIEAEGDVPTSNCDAYEVNHVKIREGSRRAAANLYNKVLSVVEKAEERDKMYRIVKNVSIDNYKQYSLSSGREINVAKIEDFPEQSQLENIAMAHYKYLGHELKKELGDSVNVRELTGDEERYVRYMNHGNPSHSVEKPPPTQLFPAYIRFYENCSEEPVTSIEIDRNTLSEDIVNGQIISNPGQKIKRIELGNITILGTSEYTRYKEDAPNIEDVGEEWRPITCFNGGCEKLATVKVLGNPYYDDESVFLRDGNCNSPTDYYKDIKFNYKITRDDP
jgi:hypothetical protein